MLEIIEKMTSIDLIILLVTLSAYLALIIGIFKNNGKGQNFYIWAMWFLLDVILLKTTYNEHGTSVILISVCVVGSFFVSFSLFIKEKLEWGKYQIITFILTIATVVIWLGSNDKYGIIFGVISQVIPGLLLMRESWKNPEPGWTLISYFLFFVGFTITTFKSPIWNIQNQFFSVLMGLCTIGDIIPLILKLFKKIKGRRK